MTDSQSIGFGLASPKPEGSYAIETDQGFKILSHLEVIKYLEDQNWNLKQENRRLKHWSSRLTFGLFKPSLPNIGD